MATNLRDLRYALRSARRQPGITVVVVLTLAVGIGANTAIFTTFRDRLWPQVAAPDPDRLFHVLTGTRARPVGTSSYLDALDYREAVADFGDLAPWVFLGAVLGLPGEGEGFGKTIFGIGAGVSPQHFDFLGARFPLGRGFLPEEDRPDGPRVAVIDHTVWTRHLGADPAILERTIRYNGVPFTIIGVTAPDFETPVSFDAGGIPIQIYVPISRVDEVFPRPTLGDRGSRWYQSLFRVHDGVPLRGLRETLEARLAVVARNLDREYPFRWRQERYVTVRGVEEATAEVDAGQLMLAGAVGLLLLLACANVANLLLARAAGRRREIAVLAALGASRGRITRRLLTESVVLAIAGGALGIAVSRWLTALVYRFTHVYRVGWGSFLEGDVALQLDARVLLFALFVSVVTGCLFGLAPILHAARTDLVGALKSGAGETRPGRRFGARQVLVVGQVMLSTVLVLLTGLLVRSMGSLRAVDVGFETEHQLLASVATAPSPSAGSPAERRDVQRQLFELARQRLGELPGVESVTLTDGVPGGGGVRTTRLVLPDRPDEDFAVDQISIGPDFFKTFGIALVRGRTFDAGDRAGGVGAVIVNQAFVDRFLADVEPLGRELRLPFLRSDTADDRYVVVGLAPDVRHATRRGDPGPVVYVAVSQYLSAYQLRAVVRTAGPPQLAMPKVRETLATAHPDLALVDLGTFDRELAVDLQNERAYTTLGGLFSLFGLGLACLGIYSVMSCAVSYRRRELGIRMAVGAAGRDLVRLVLGETFRLVAAGIGLGLVAALVLARLLTSLLYGVAPHDPGTFVVLPLLLAAAGLAAAWLPAWRAGRVDPKLALQEE